MMVIVPINGIKFFFAKGVTSRAK